jgi:hypothetical protein
MAPALAEKMAALLGILERPVPPRAAAGGAMRAGSQGLAGNLNTPPSCPLCVNSRAVSMDERGEGEGG